MTPRQQEAAAITGARWSPWFRNPDWENGESRRRGSEPKDCVDFTDAP